MGEIDPVPYHDNVSHWLADRVTGKITEYSNNDGPWHIRLDFPGPPFTFNGQQCGLYTQRMLRNNRWKYIWNTTDIDELYNLKDDPHELENLIGEKKYSFILGELRKKLYDILLEQGDGLVKSDWMKHQLLENRKIDK